VAEELARSIIGSQSVTNCLKETIGMRRFAAYSVICSVGMVGK